MRAGPKRGASSISRPSAAAARSRSTTSAVQRWGDPTGQPVAEGVERPYDPRMDEPTVAQTVGTDPIESVGVVRRGERVLQLAVGHQQVSARVGDGRRAEMAWAACPGEGGDTSHRRAAGARAIAGHFARGLASKTLQKDSDMFRTFGRGSAAHLALE